MREKGTEQRREGVDIWAKKTKLSLIRVETGITCGKMTIYKVKRVSPF